MSQQVLKNRQPKTRFLRGINHTPGVGGRIVRGDPKQGPPKHPVIRASEDPQTPGKLRVTVLCHQDAYGPEPGKVLPIDDTRRTLTWHVPQEEYLTWPVCTYSIQGDRIVSIKEEGLDYGTER